MLSSHLLSSVQIILFQSTSTTLNPPCRSDAETRERSRNTSSCVLFAIRGFANLLWAIIKTNTAGYRFKLCSFNPHTLCDLRHNRSYIYNKAPRLLPTQFMQAHFLNCWTVIFVSPMQQRSVDYPILAKKHLIPICHPPLILKLVTPVERATSECHALKRSFIASPKYLRGREENSADRT